MSAQTATNSTQKRGRIARRETQEGLLFLLLVGPNLLLFVLFTYWPLLYSAYLSFVR